MTAERIFSRPTPAWESQRIQDSIGTPFDGGSGIALNEAFPLKAIIFIERGEENSVRVPENKEIIQKLYFQTAHMVSASVADKMLENFGKLLSLTRFYVLTCNTKPDAARKAFQFLIENAPLR